MIIYIICIIYIHTHTRTHFYDSYGHQTLTIGQRYWKRTSSRDIFLEYFQFFLGYLFWRSHANVFWSLDHFLVFDKEASECSLSEKVTGAQKNSYSRNSSKKKYRGSPFFSKAASFTAKACICTPNIVFIILAL